MNGRSILILPLVLVLVAALFSGAEARQAAGNTTWPLSYIRRPCTWISIRPTGGGPPAVVCYGVTGRTATINVPTAWLSDRSPELSLVNLPTFFNVEWDPASMSAEDSRPLTISYPVGNPTDKLINVRVQLRLVALPAVGYSLIPSRLVSGNLRVETPDPLYLLKSDDRSELHAYACDAPTPMHADLSVNPLFLVPTTYGGYGTPGCAAIERSLADVGANLPRDVPSGFGSAERYPGWTSIEFPRILAFTPYASIRGEGLDHGSPAFQIKAGTRFIIQARVIWDRHEERHESVTSDCQWSYRNHYDFIDWTRWPDPIYCRNNVTVYWDTFCTPADGNCPYGSPNDWWLSSEPIELWAIRGPDGAYGETYDFVSVQSQALLTTP